MGQQRRWKVQLRTPRGLELLDQVAESERAAMQAVLAGDLTQAKVMQHLKPDARCSLTCEGHAMTFCPDELGGKLAVAVGAGKDAVDEPFQVQTALDALPKTLPEALGQGIVARAMEKVARDLAERNEEMVKRMLQGQWAPPHAGQPDAGEVAARAARMLGLDHPRQVQEVGLGRHVATGERRVRVLTETDMWGSYPPDRTVHSSPGRRPQRFSERGVDQAKGPDHSVWVHNGKPSDHPHWGRIERILRRRGLDPSEVTGCVGDPAQQATHFHTPHGTYTISDFEMINEP